MLCYAAALQFARIYTPVILLACALLAFLPWAFVPASDRSVGD